MLELDHKEGWMPKNWCFQTVVLEKTPESLLDCKRSNQSINPGNQTRKSILNIHWKNWCWSSISWPPDTKSQLTRKDPDAGKDWRQEKKGVTEDRQDCRMILPTQWIRVWASSGRWWRAGKPGVLQATGSQRVRPDGATEQRQWVNHMVCKWTLIKLKNVNGTTNLYTWL